VVEEQLRGDVVGAASPEILKWRAATLANLEAAMLCNHTKQEREITPEARVRAEQRLASAHERVTRAERGNAAEVATLQAIREQMPAADAVTGAPDAGGVVHVRGQQRLTSAQKRYEASRARLERAHAALVQVEIQQDITAKKRGWNLGTSLKSYVDPRVYHRWGSAVGYDVLERYYPTTLRRKYAWVREEEDGASAKAAVSVETCLPSDLPDVAGLLGRVAEAYPDVSLPMTDASSKALAIALLPDLRGDWRESFVARDEDGALVAVVTLGPPFAQGKAMHIDLSATIDPSATSPALGRRLAEEARRRTRTFLLALKGRGELHPRRTDWYVVAADMVAALGLDVGEPLTPGREAD
jgi:hypothetical protein